MDIRTRHLASAGLLLGIVMLAGCSGAADGSASSPPPSSPPAATQPAASSADPAASPAPSDASASTDPNAPEGNCSIEQLSVTLGTQEGAAGSTHVPVLFTNVSDTTCVLQGEPGVSAVGGGDGSQIGQPAEQEQTVDPPAIEIIPGAAASAEMSMVSIGDNGGPLAGDCPVVAADGWRVYPPHSFDSTFVEVDGLMACDSDVVWLQIGAVSAA